MIRFDFCYCSMTVIMAISPPMSFYLLDTVANLKEGYIRRFNLVGQDILLIHSNSCPHDGSSLKKGRVSGGCIRCPKHGICFDLDTGSPLGGEVVNNIGSLKILELIEQSGQLGINIE